MDVDIDDSEAIAQRRLLRQDYRNLLTSATARKKEYLEGNTDLLLQDLERANMLFGTVNSTSEGVLDSQFLILSADISAQKAHQMRIDSAAFDSLEYVEKLRETLYGTDADMQQMTGKQPDWAKLGEVAAKFTRKAPRFSYIYGPLMAEVKHRKRTVQQRGRRNGRADQSQVASIETMEAGDIKKQENQTTKLVRKVHKILTEVGPINLFKLVINPQSFAQSVENIFYVSFLIRDGKAFIDDQSGQPMIEACEPPQQNDYEQGLSKRQLIFSLEYASWKEIIEVYKIVNCAIPSRKTKIGPDGMSQISSQVPL
ncbi:hypothetical protein DL89DRAFT_270115 [Linderina pennispora]|uniref:Non-structural maintenance of chromosomes element 4 n=1 Tax=Linderina pennispora TaxID=61395 RepID=A0A1Y1VZ81_9FUNG|nr:uncharacterized protein DL89DRAFT_270115 [Linderina pennispora]ORX66578.1 hypothetical protein DL89DRAFT_270115 [Linderina pennispora]